MRIQLIAPHHVDGVFHLRNWRGLATDNDGRRLVREGVAIDLEPQEQAKPKRRGRPPVSRAADGSD